MQKAMTNAELAILSLVVERPRHGYEIEQVIEERGMRDWTEVGFSSIYYLLKKLEREGLVEGRLQEAGRGPARRVYHATTAGMEARRTGVLDALSTPRRGTSPLLLGLSNLPGILPTEAVAALRQCRAALSTRLEHVQEKWDSQRPVPPYVDAMFDHSVTMLKTEIAWIDNFIVQMDGGNDQDRL
jgi:DNA-binding PadR family transcriptional regulator